jgi:hypothetical protein
MKEVSQMPQLRINSDIVYSPEENIKRRLVFIRKMTYVFPISLTNVSVIPESRALNKNQLFK